MRCRVVRTENLVESFACVDVAFWQSQFSRGLEEYSMVHASKGSFEVGVGCVDVFFTSWCPRTSLYARIVCRISFCFF